MWPGDAWHWPNKPWSMEGKFSAQCKQKKLNHVLTLSPVKAFKRDRHRQLIGLLERWPLGERGSPGWVQWAGWEPLCALAQPEGKPRILLEGWQSSSSPLVIYRVMCYLKSGVMQASRSQSGVLFCHACMRSPPSVHALREDPSVSYRFTGSTNGRKAALSESSHQPFCSARGWGGLLSIISFDLLTSQRGNWDHRWEMKLHTTQLITDHSGLDWPPLAPGVAISPKTMMQRKESSFS